MKDLYLLKRTDKHRAAHCGGQLDTAVVAISNYDELQAIIGGLFLNKTECDFTFCELTGEIIDFEKSPSCLTFDGRTLNHANVFAKHIGTTSADSCSGVINRSYIR